MTNTKTKVSGINMQSLPEVGISFDRTSPLSETNLDLGKLTFTLSEPAPVGGLSVNYNAVDSDGVPNDIDVSTINGTVLFDENGSPSGILIDEGATEARFEIIPKQDNISEGEEFSIINLLPGDGYTIDPNNNTATFFLTDLPIVTFSVDRTVISEGGESQIFTFQLNEPAPDGGLTVKLQLEDPDGDIGDGGFPPQLFNNISDSNFVVENGKLIQEFTISPGATEASFGFVAGEDNKVEGDETYTLTLLDGEDYSIDAASKPIVSTITDAGENLSGINFDEHNLTGANITVLDVNSLLDDVIANPEEFGLTNVTEPFLDPLTLTSTAGANPDEYLFYDTVDPTVAGYTLVSDLALETLAVEAEY